FAALEPPRDAVEVDISASIDACVDSVAARLAAG
ncbi:MAG: hypothetical protein HW392_2118, partial [Steroidobacteraceae bacterium]|nr:hypothetical protein [Steroidobacteraceae bacterium]